MAGHALSARWSRWLARWLPAGAAGRERRLRGRQAAASRRLSPGDAQQLHLLESVPDGICVSRDGRVAYGNVALAKLMGLADPREAIGQRVFDFVDPEFHPMIRSGRLAGAIGVLMGPEEIRLRRVDGSQIPVELRVVALDADAGGSFLNVVRDLTEQRRAEADARLRAEVLDQSTDGVVVANERGRVVYVNPAFCRLRKAEPEALLGRPARELVEGNREGEGEGRPVDPDAIREQLNAGKTWSGRYRFRDETGELHRDTCCFAVRDASGNIHGIAALVRDKTQEVRLEQHAEQSRRLAAVGQLAGGLAHDLSNLLTVILGHVELLSQQAPDQPGVGSHVRGIGEAAERSAAMARQLLAFGRRRALDPRVIDLAQVVRDQRVLLAELLPARIALHLDLDATLAPVRVDPAVVQQALTELVTNARDAIEGPGTIRVGAHAHGSGVALYVEDDGAGMDASTRERMFEPFFTTGEVGAGAGLGLATTHGLVTQSGGSLEVESEPGQGTRIRILLPEAPLTAASPAAESEQPGASEGGATLLLVEDEDRLRALARRALSEAGYRVLEAADGRAALEVAAAHPGAIDLLVCDVVLPGPDGGQLAERLRAARPELRVLLMAGYAPDAEAGRPAAVAGAHFLPKPFRMRDLRAHVRAALDAPAPARGEG